MISIRDDEEPWQREKRVQEHDSKAEKFLGDLQAPLHTATTRDNDLICNQRRRFEKGQDLDVSLVLSLIEKYGQAIFGHDFPKAATLKKQGH